MEDAIWANLTPPVLRQRRRDRRSDGPSRSGAKRPQNWIRWSLDAVSLLLGGATKMEMMKILETIITPDDLLRNINSNQSRCDWIASSANQNDNTRKPPKNGLANSFGFHCQPFVLIGNDYHLFDGHWTCLAAGGQTVVFENLPLLESAQVSGGDFNNWLFKGDDCTSEQSVDLLNGPAARRSPALGKRGPSFKHLSLKWPTRRRSQRRPPFSHRWTAG